MASTGSDVRTAVVWETLRAALAELPAGPLDILDIGGGTGGFAVPLAELGHRVTVVDPSPDSLAALERRAAEAGIGPIRAVQGDAAGIADVAQPGGYHAALCHRVLEVVDDPGQALTELARVLRPGGLLSILVANRAGAVLSRAVAGRFSEALGLAGAADGVASSDAVASRGAAAADRGSSAVPADLAVRRFARREITALLAQAGLSVRLVHGARVVTDLLPGHLLDDPSRAADLVRLERMLANATEFIDVAAQLHFIAGSPVPAPQAG